MTVSSSLRIAALLLLGGLALAACSDKPVPPCPSVRVDDSTSRYVKFQKNAERDLTEVVYGAALLGYDGQCVFSKKGVEVVMDLTFEVQAGPGAKSGTVEIPYFIALPQYFPKDYGKRVMFLHAKLGKPGTRERIKVPKVQVFLPLKKDEPAASFDVYVGLQMTDADADYNVEREKHLEAERVPAAAAKPQ